MKIPQVKKFCYTTFILYYPYIQDKIFIPFRPTNYVLTLTLLNFDSFVFMSYSGVWYFSIVYPFPLSPLLGSRKLE